jgi:predicted amidohydrolase
MKIAVASPPYPRSIEDGLVWIERLIKEAAREHAEIICFPESYIPGYPAPEYQPEPATPEKLRSALDKTRELAAASNIAVILPMDWYKDDRLFNVAFVLSNTGEVLGYQTKNQLDPSEDHIWIPGTERSIFEINGVKFGIVICHEGFRYPETVRWAAIRDAQIVFHPNLTGSDVEGVLLVEWGNKDNPYYEKAQMMRALENTIYFASSNYACAYPESASAIIHPDGTCIAHQAYRQPGVTVADIDLKAATGLLAKRFKAELYAAK